MVAKVAGIEAAGIKNPAPQAGLRWHRLVVVRLDQLLELEHDCDHASLFSHPLNRAHTVLHGMLAAVALPASVLGDECCSHGFQLLISVDCRARSSGV